MIKLVKQLNGGSIALGVIGDNETEIKQELDALWNWNIWGRQAAVNMDTRHNTLYQDEAKELTDNFKYVYTTEDRFRRGLKNRIINKLQDRPEIMAQFKGKPGGFMPVVNAELAQTLSNIETQDFV